MKYEVYLMINKKIICQWYFKSITQVCKFLENCDLDFIDAEVIRLKDLHSFDAMSLLEVWKR